MANTKIKNTVLDSSVISGQTTVTAATNDFVMIQDVSDSNNLKKALISDFGGSTSFVVEDDDGTEVTIDNDKELKFIGSGITTNFTDTSTGSDGDPFDLTFTIDAAQTGITSILATDLKIGEDDQTKIDFETADEIHFYAANAEQVFVSDGVFGPQTDSDVDLGTTSARFKDAFVDSITVTGEVDGASLDISGDADIDGTLEADAITVNGTALDEFIQDTVGAMVSSNTESGITVTYQDGDGTLDFSVSGGGSSTTINNNADNRLITGSGTADTLEGEANATFNGNTLALTAGTGNTGISLTDGSTNYGFIGGGNALKSGGSANDFSFRTDTGSIDFYTNGQNLRFAIESDGVINTSEAVRIGSGTTFENEALNVRKTGSNDDAVLALDSDTGDASFYRFIRFYKKNNNDSLAKLDYDASGDTIGLAVESDERYKQITGPAVGLDLISKLEPIKYTREDTGVTDGCGFGAQSYKKAFDDIGEYPRGVTVGSDTVKWELDYSPLVPNLVKAIQEQQELIEILQNEIEKLKGES